MKPLTDIDRLRVLQRGLCVPLLTPFDGKNEFSSGDFDRLMNYVYQDGRGGRIFFINGTTGEFNYIKNDVRQKIISSACSYKEKKGGDKLSLWCGLAGDTPSETLENLLHAYNENIDAGVIAPLYFLNHNEILSFFRRDVKKVMDNFPAHLPVFLYDNKDILSHVLAIQPILPLTFRERGGYILRILLQRPDNAVKQLIEYLNNKKDIVRQVRGYLYTREVKQLSRLDYIVGIKVSAPLRILGNYIRASRHFRELGEFGIYVGNAPLIFEIFSERRGIMKLVKWWQKFALQSVYPHGVVAGPANVLPLEWATAWDAAVSGDTELISIFRKVFEKYKKICTFNGKRKSIACAKFALFMEGIISTPNILDRDKSLTLREKKSFETRYNEFKKYLTGNIPPEYRSGK